MKGSVYLITPSVSIFFSSLCRDERETFMTIAQLEMESGIRIAF